MVLTETGEIFMLANLQKILAQSFGTQVAATGGTKEMIRVANQQEVHIQSLSPASAVDGRAPLSEMVVWGISTEFDDQTKGYAVYQGVFDLSSGEPQIFWQSLGFTADKIALHRAPDAALILSGFGQVYTPKK